MDNFSGSISPTGYLFLSFSPCCAVYKFWTPLCLLFKTKGNKYFDVVIKRGNSSVYHFSTARRLGETCRYVSFFGPRSVPNFQTDKSPFSRGCLSKRTILYLQCFLRLTVYDKWAGVYVFRHPCAQFSKYKKSIIFPGLFLKDEHFLSVVFISAMRR